MTWVGLLAVGVLQMAFAGFALYLAHRGAWLGGAFFLCWAIKIEAVCRIASGLN